MKKIELKVKKLSFNKETIALLNKKQSIKEEDKRWTGKSDCQWCGTNN